MLVLHIQPQAVTARTTGVNRGRRVYRSRQFQRVDRVEVDFIPPAGTRPTQARIRHYSFEPRLQRWLAQVDLVVQADLEAAGVIEPAGETGRANRIESVITKVQALRDQANQIATSLDDSREFLDGVSETHDDLGEIADRMVDGLVPHDAPCSGRCRRCVGLGAGCAHDDSPIESSGAANAGGRGLSPDAPIVGRTSDSGPRAVSDPAPGSLSEATLRDEILTVLLGAEIKVVVGPALAERVAEDLLLAIDRRVS